MSANPLCVSVQAPIGLTRLHKRLIGVTAGLFAIAVPVSAVHADLPTETPFTSPEGDFIVAFPGNQEPIHTSQSVDSGPSAYQGDYYVVNHRGDVYMALTGSTDTSVYDSADDALEDFAMGVYLGLGGEETSDRRFRFRGFEAIETSGTVDAPTVSGSLVGRGYFGDDHIWGVFVITQASTTAADDATVAAFFDSFDFVKEAF